MRKIYKVLKVAVAASLLTGIVSTAGCTRNESLSAETAPASADSDPDRISIESALSALARFQADDSATRAEAPAVKKVDVLMRSDVAAVTRSAGAASDAPLCYIAQFEGGGYAILGADAKQGGVIAYVPKGTLTASELAEAKAATDRGEDYETPTYIHAGIVAYLEAAADGLAESNGDTDHSNTPATRVDIPFYPEPSLETLMFTEWSQWAPYNNWCEPNSSGTGRKPVGCVALTLGQILAYNKSRTGIGPEKIVPYGPYFASEIYYPQWTIITKAIETTVPPATCRNELARYLYKIGRAVKMVYNDTLSETIIDYAADFLRNQAGYKNVSKRSANLKDIKTMLQNDTPVYASGLAAIPDSEYHILQGGNHSWVIDGWKQKKEYFITGTGGSHIKYTNYVHCRFGYDGKYDGWYTYWSEMESSTYHLTDIIYYTL